MTTNDVGHDQNAIIIRSDLHAESYTNTRNAGRSAAEGIAFRDYLRRPSSQEVSVRLQPLHNSH